LTDSVNEKNDFYLFSIVNNDFDWAKE